MIEKKITDLEQVKSISDESSYLVETESGTRHIRHKDLVAGIEKALPIGDMEELEKLEKLEDQEELEQPSVKENLTLAKAILKVLSIATAVFKGTDGVKAGNAGMVPTPGPNDKDSFLRGDGIWAKISGGGGGDVAAENVKFSDGKTAEEKLGMIDGATDDLNCENDKMVAKMVAVKQLNDSLNFPDGTHFYPDIRDGVAGYNTEPERGADTFHPFKNGASSGSVYFKAGNSADFTDIIKSLGKTVNNFTNANFKPVISGGGGVQISAFKASGSDYMYVTTPDASFGISYNSGTATVTGTTSVALTLTKMTTPSTNIRNGFNVLGIIFDPSDTPFAS